jgi:hypothetical protein
MVVALHEIMCEVMYRERSKSMKGQEEEDYCDIYKYLPIFIYTCIYIYISVSLLSVLCLSPSIIKLYFGPPEHIVQSERTNTSVAAGGGPS